jgi:glycosyltransferase involved in cell wall biosynthesis
MSNAPGKLKILIYGEYFLPVVGGVQTAIHLLAKGLAELDRHEHRDGDPREIDVTVATKTAANGMDDCSLPYRVVRRPPLRRLLMLIRDADVVHVAGPCLLPMAFAWLMSKPFVVEHHGYQANCPNGLLFRQPVRTVCPGYFAQKKYEECLRCLSAELGPIGALRTFLLTFLRRWLCMKAATNIAISNHVAARLKVSRSHTVYYGVAPPDSVEGEGAVFSSAPFEVAYVGRLFAEKGPRVLLQAAQTLSALGSNIKVVFIGDGPERKRLETLAENSGLKGTVEFTGDLRGSALDHAIRKVAVVVMPSLCEETAGLSAIEQMMRGRVVIASDTGGLAEIVGDSGLKFPPGDGQALAACIQRVILDPMLAESIGSAARRRAAHLFRHDSMIRSHVVLYASAYRRKESSV